MTFLEAIESIPDPRGRNTTDPLAGFLSSVLLAVLSGANSTRTVAAFLRVRYAELNALLGLNWKPHRLPVQGTVHHILRQLPHAAIAQALSLLEGESTALPKGQGDGPLRVLAIDGKRLRGSASRLHAELESLISLFDTEGKWILCHVPVQEKESELSAAQTLLETLELQGHVVTLDALHTQKKR
jgi:hypothetical protein